MNAWHRPFLRASLFLIGIAWCGSVCCSAAEAVDTPRKPNPVAVAENVPPHLAPATQSDNKWRFKYHDGRWWYWMTDETWVYWQDNRWLHYDPATFVRETQPQIAAAPATGGTTRNSANAYSRGFRGRGGYYYGNEANRPVAVPFMGYPGISPYVPRSSGRGFVPFMIN